MRRRLFQNPLVTWAVAFQVLFICSVTIWKVAANALVIARAESASLPLLYILSALTTGLLAAATGRGATRSRLAPPGHLLPWACGAALLFFAVLPWLSAAGLSALYLAAEAYATLVSLRFWEAMGNTFNARQARREFTILGAAGMAGAMLGGGLSSAVSRLGVRYLLPLGALAAVGALFAARAFARQVPAEGSAVRRARRKPGGLRDALAYAKADPYPRGLAACAMLLAVLTAVVDYHFRRRAGDTLGERDLASLFGWLNLVVGFVAVAVQLGLSQRVLSRFGIFRYLMAPPLGVALAAGASLIAPGLWPVFAEKTIENAGSFSITQSGFQLLYNPIPAELTGAVRGLVDGFMKKAGFALGGLLLLLVGTRAPGSLLTLLALSCAVACAFAIDRQKQLYVRALAQRLSARSKEDAREEVIGGRLDADARGLLMEELFSTEPHRVLNALELLQQDDQIEVRPFLPTLLDHPAERVREAGVKLARKLRAVEVAPRLVALAQTERERRPRDEAVRALAVVLPEADAIAHLRAFLGSADPGLRAAAIEALFRLGGAARTEAEAVLASAVTGTQPAERREAARLVGRLRRPSATNQLRASLADPDDSVRCVACHAAAELKDQALIAPLFDLLPARVTRRAAREALIAIGEPVLAEAKERLDDRSQPLALRLEMPKLLRAIGSEQAAEILLFSNIDDDAFLRYRIGSALARWRSRNPDLPVDETRVREAIARRVKAYWIYVPVAADVRAGLGDRALLSRALDGRLTQNVEILFQLLGLLYPQRILHAAHRRFAAPDPTGQGREQAQALELVDSLIDDELREQILPILEHELARRAADGPRGDRAASGRQGTRTGGGARGDPSALTRRLVELSGSRDNILRDLARAARGAEGQRAVAKSQAPGAAGPEIEPKGAPPSGATGGGRPFSDSSSENDGGDQVLTLALEKVLLLEGVDIFAGCSVDDLTALAQIAREQRFEPGEPIYREGEAGETLYVIVEGQVRIQKQERTILRLSAREAFGSVSLLDGSPRPADAIADTQVHTLAIDREDFLDLVSDRPELLKGVFHVVTGQLRKMLELAARANAAAA